MLSTLTASRTACTIGNMCPTRLQVNGWVVAAALLAAVRFSRQAADEERLDTRALQVWLQYNYCTVSLHAEDSSELLAVARMCMPARRDHGIFGWLYDLPCRRGKLRAGCRVQS